MQSFVEFWLDDGPFDESDKVDKALKVKFRTVLWNCVKDCKMNVTREIGVW